MHSLQSSSQEQLRLEAKRESFSNREVGTKWAAYAWPSVTLSPAHYNTHAPPLSFFWVSICSLAVLELTL